MDYDIPDRWRRLGLVLARDESKGNHVVGDPCIVWDEELPGWRMFLYYNPPGHAQAVCCNPDDTAPGGWELAGPIQFANPQELIGGEPQKPFIVMEAHHPNHAARVDGSYRLLMVGSRGGHKIVQGARAERLGGPWTVERGALIDVGRGGDFDAKHTDAVTGFFFPEREEILYFYMGYPLLPQERRISPYGSAQAVAAQGVRENTVRKLGVILSPCQQEGHWASGWVGGLQLLPGRTHRWIAVLNASPNAPDPADESIHREEPPPSLAGFAYTDESWPVKGWTWSPEPIEWIEDLPREAVDNGEGVNLWRQHILCPPSGDMILFYNSGSYGLEQLYAKMAAGA